MSTERELLVRARPLLDALKFETHTSVVLKRDIDAYLKEPERPLLRATFSGVPARLEKVSDSKLGDYFVWVEEPKGEKP